MYQKAHPLFLTCETPTHAGSGSELGIVDLPIQREKHTSFPKIEASSLKGSLREAFERSVGKKDFAAWNDADTKIHRLFGYDDGSLNKAAITRLQNQFTYQVNNEAKLRNEFSGCVGFTDARLLLFPIKSMKGVFAWITCPKVLQQFATDMELTGIALPALPQGFNLIPSKSDLVLAGKKGAQVVLEEYAFEVQEDEPTSQFCEWLARQVFHPTQGYSQQKVKKDVVVLSNDDFKDFVNLSTEVITRTKIDNQTGTVEAGALFTEEYLPAETVMYSLLLTANEFTQNSNAMTEAQAYQFFAGQLPEVIQLGGNATLGKGILRTRLNHPQDTEKTTEEKGENNHA